MLYPLGFTGGFEVVQGPEVELHETFVEGVIVIVGVGLRRVVTVPPEAVVVASLPDVPVVDPPEVELTLGEVVAEGETEAMGAEVVLEAFMTVAIGFFAGAATAFTWARGGDFNATILLCALFTLDKRLFSTSAKVLSLL